jgi:hypothetical protein
MQIKITPRQLKASQLPELRAEILREQDGCCSICLKKIQEESGSLDHQHKLKSKPSGPDGDGLIRGVLDRSCNSWEGSIWNNTTRYRQPKNVQDRINMLEELINFYKMGTYDIIHPTEKPKEQKVSKRNYNKMNKIYSKENKKRKFPEYPKTSKLTLGLKILFEEYNIPPYN